MAHAFFDDSVMAGFSPTLGGGASGCGGSSTSACGWSV
jgi:hypothetical protein